MALKVCAEPGCPTLTRTTRCPTHERQRYQQRVREGGRARGNRPEVIAAIRARDGHQCIRCGSASRLRVHHIVERQHGGSDDPENLALLCHACHEREHHG